MKLMNKTSQYSNTSFVCNSAKMNKTKAGRKKRTVIQNQIITLKSGIPSFRV